MIIGKLLGLVLGYLIGGSLVAALLGALVGHVLDRIVVSMLFGKRFAETVGSAAGGRAHRRAAAAASAGTSEAFFDATFSVMGHVAKADGRVDESEIALASALMTRMRLSPERRREAIARFEEGKAANFALERVLARLERTAPGQTALFVSFLQIQMQVAMADGEFDAAEEAVLLEIARLLGVPALVFRQIQMIARMSRQQAGAAGGGRAGGATGGGWSGSGRSGGGAGGAGSRTAGRSRPALADAFAVLGVAPDADRATTKAAWRREISENHPDKLASQGLPKEMMDAATDRTQAIQQAWDTIREAKGWR